MKRFYSIAGMMVCALMVLSASVFATSYEAQTPEEFFDHMEMGLREQYEVFEIDYAGDVADLALGGTTLPQLQRQMSAQDEAVAGNADSVAFNINYGEVIVVGGVVFFVDMEYLSTPEELAYVVEQSKVIIAQLDLAEESPFAKVKLINEYVTENFVYDDSLTKFSAYEGLTEGTMVCQGYALLTNQLLWDAGVPSRIVTGTSRGENHAWNIVLLDDKWYNLDTTWDAADEKYGIIYWDFFLKNQEDFVGHERFGAYVSADYLGDHPMAETSMELPRVEMTVGEEPLGGLIIRNGVDVQMDVILPKGYEDAKILWTSNDETVAQIPDGMLQSDVAGATWISAEVEGAREVITDQLMVTAVDMRTVSSWAMEDVTGFYLAQLLPVSLCSDYQEGITRAEMARLIQVFIQKTEKFPSFSVKNTYEDIDGHPDAFAILDCKAMGIMLGTSETTFSPDEIVTREQAAAIFVRLLNYLDDEDYTSGTEMVFADVDDISPWAKPAVEIAFEQEIMKGSDGNFYPHDMMTREEVFVTLYRIYVARYTQSL